MTSAFAITAATSAVELNAERRGETSFTVSNASGSLVRARVRVVPESPALPDWFTIAGENERSYPVGGTHQYTVQIAVPPDVPTGNYAFRLDAIGVDNPDEEFVQGPAVAFSVTSAPVKVTTKKGYLATLTGTIVGALAGAALGFLLGSIVGGMLEGSNRGLASIVTTTLQWLFTWGGAVAGTLIALRNGNHVHPVETTGIVAVAAPVWGGLVVGGLLLIGIGRILEEGGGGAALLLVVSGVLVLVVPPLGARAMTLFWKTGRL